MSSGVVADVAAQVKQIVDALLPLDRHEPRDPHKYVLPQFFEVEVEKYRWNQIPTQLYVFALFHSIIQEPDRWMKDGTYFSEAQLVLSMSDSPQKDARCHAHLLLDLNPTAPMLQLRVNSRHPRVESYPYPQEMLSFSKSFQAAVEDCPSRLTAFPLSITAANNRAHDNMLVVLKIRPQQYILMVYEPHGFAAVSEYARARQEFVRMLELTLPDKYMVLPLSTFLCARGLQRVAEDKLGYCVMFSHFWFYCMLRCLPILLKARSVKQLKLAIANVESTIINSYHTKRLQRVIVAFAIRFCDEFWKQAVLTESDLESMRTSVRQTIQEESKTVHPQAPKFVRKLLPHHAKGDYDEDEDEDDQSSRRSDGAACERNEDCLSHCCHSENKTCVPYDFDAEQSEADLVDEEDDLMFIFLPLVEETLHNLAKHQIEGTEYQSRKPQKLFQYLACVQKHNRNVRSYLDLFTSFLIPEHVMPEYVELTYDWTKRTLDFGDDEYVPITSSRIEFVADDLPIQPPHNNHPFSVILLTLLDAEAAPSPHHLLFIHRRRQQNQVMLFGYRLGGYPDYYHSIDALGQRFADVLQTIQTERGSQVSIQWAGLFEVAPLFDQTPPSAAERCMLDGFSFFYFMTMTHRSHPSTSAVAKSFVSKWVQTWSEARGGEAFVLETFAREILYYNTNANITKTCMD